MGECILLTFLLEIETVLAFGFFEKFGHVTSELRCVVVLQESDR